MLIKASIGEQLGSFCIQTDPAEGATYCGSLIALKRLPSASYRQGLTDLHQNLDIYLIHRNKHKEAAKKGRLRNRSQVKEQENSPELEEIETSNLSNTEFRVMIIRILNSMKRGIETLKKRTSQI